MNSQNPASIQDIRQTILISVGVVAVGLTLYFIFRDTPTTTTTKSTSAVQIAAITPASYTMISGRITAIDQPSHTVTVDFPTVSAKGKNEVKRYTITVNEATVLQTTQTSATPPSSTSIGLADLAVGDMVDALGGTNVAPLDAFTATTIIRLQP